MQLTKMAYEKLLAAIDGEKKETADWRRAAEVASKRALDLGKELEAKADLERDHDSARKTIGLLATKVAVRDEALVQLALRLSFHGDPEPIAGTE
jgi:capsid protein